MLPRCSVVAASRTFKVVTDSTCAATGRPPAAVSTSASASEMSKVSALDCRSGIEAPSAAGAPHPFEALIAEFALLRKPPPALTSWRLDELGQGLPQLPAAGLAAH